jgi:integrase
MDKSSTVAKWTKWKAKNKRFPLSVVQNGQWGKKIRGKRYYFGPLDDKDGSLSRYLHKRDFLFAGLDPPSFETVGVTVGKVCGDFLDCKKKDVQRGAIKQCTLDCYEDAVKVIYRGLGEQTQVRMLTPKAWKDFRDFIARDRSPVSQKNIVSRTRSIFGYMAKMKLIEPPDYGPAFSPPRKPKRTDVGMRMFEAEEIRAMLDTTGNVAMRSQILLGINCGFGNSDCESLPLANLDLARGWHNYPRPKNGQPRECWLWPETVQAIEDWIAIRPEAANQCAEKLLFLTPTGKSYVSSNRTIGQNFGRLLKQLKLYKKLSGFYWLRHTCETIGGDSIDQVAVDYIMGHAGHGMARIYREKIFGERVKNVSNHIRKWLFA